MKSSSKLFQLQKEFLELFRSKHKDGSLSALPIPRESLFANFQQERLQIYQDSYVQRLQDSLQEDFPSVHETLGELEWSKRISVALEQLTCEDYLIGNFSHQFFAFVIDHPTDWKDVQTEAKLDFLELLPPPPYPPNLKKLSAEDLQKGAPFLLWTEPAVCWLTDWEIGLLSETNQAQFFPVTERQSQLLRFLKNPQPPSKLETWLLQNNVDRALSSLWIQEWVRFGVLICVK